QVLIEVLIAEVTLTDALAYGVEHFFRQNFGSGLISLEPSSVISAAAVPNPLSGGTRVFRLRKDITTIFNLLDTTTQVEVLSTPHILVQDEEAATIQVGASEPILAQQISVPIAGTTPTTTGGTFATQNQVQYRDIGVILTVKPRIGENRMVTIQVTQEVTNLAQEVTRGINSPRFTTRKAETFLTVEDEHTIVIGGIIETRLENTIRRVPVLNRVPLLGKLFKSEDKTKRKTELLVLLTPRIVSTSDEIDLATKNFEEKLKLIESLRKEQK
ncbi:MAG TPA: type II secretion system protein GspD, partial [Candidatus Tripitaka californicus]